MKREELASKYWYNETSCSMVIQLDSIRVLLEREMLCKAQYREIDRSCKMSTCIYHHSGESVRAGSVEKTPENGRKMEAVTQRSYPMAEFLRLWLVMAGTERIPPPDMITVLLLLPSYCHFPEFSCRKSMESVTGIIVLRGKDTTLSRLEFKLVKICYSSNVA
jgi:hypothetical protein